MAQTYLELVSMQVSDQSLGDKRMDIRVEVQSKLGNLNIPLPSGFYPAGNKYTRVGKESYLQLNLCVPFDMNLEFVVFKERTRESNEQQIASFTFSIDSVPVDQSGPPSQVSFESDDQRVEFVLDYGATQDSPLYVTLGELYCVEASDDISEGTANAIAGNIDGAYTAFGKALGAVPDPTIAAVGSAAEAVGKFYAGVISSIGGLGDDTDNVYMTCGDGSDKYNKIWPTTPYRAMSSSASVAILSNGNTLGSTYLSIPLLKYAYYKVYVSLWDSDAGSDTSLGTCLLDGTKYSEGKSLNPTDGGFTDPDDAEEDNPGFVTIYGNDGDKGGVYILTYIYTTGLPS